VRRHAGRIGLALVASIVLVKSSAAQATAPSRAPELTLRLCGEKRGLLVGAALNAAALRDDSNYRALAGGEFSLVTPENVMKMGLLRPAREAFAWADADALLQFAQDHQQAVHGHTLVWHRQIPRWLDERKWTRDELIDILREHILAVVGRYKGRVKMWDVVNEAVEGDGSLRQSIWLRMIGPEYIELAFRWAHEADPAALLLYNDFGAEGLGRKSDGVYRLVADLKSRGVPIGGIGLQMHMALGGHIPEDDFRMNLERLANLGLELHVTEADIRIPMPVTSSALQSQAEEYGQLLKIFIGNRNARSWTFWGITDRYSWVPAEFKSYGAALPWDGEYQPKPAHRALLDALGAVMH
jgi:endo-1,4-beta-xylanase